ncbi:lipopolysaccharide biosynthesis protein [Pedobacter sp. SYP-B3415]|uniref:lipopolysaccharide biosynthesis protein n=1 Tax=Pedobacter sp. SYP-B3415 TaxID=2496641 RepID=UPI00101C3D60|nr:lipopolysaccharide biosynthesis protein [Pedobacter sp. SYP-B3415]
MSLKEKTLAALAWAFSQQISAQVINLVVNILLARMLMPAAFGMIAMLTVFIQVATSLLDSGLTSSLIRDTDAGQDDYSTVFFFNLGGGIIAYSFVFMIAPAVQDFYHQAGLADVLRVYALVFVINALFSVQNARLTAQMNFKIQLLMHIPSVAGAGLLGLLLAYLGFGVWSLVWMNLFLALSLAVLHWTFSAWRPSWVFSMACFRKHFRFGYKMTLTGLLEILYRNLYVLLIGKYYSAAQLGYYARADSLSQLPVVTVSTVIGKVTYPMFSGIQSDNLRLKQLYRKIMQQVLFWNAPVLICLTLIAEPLLVLLLTEKWLPAVPYFQILALAGIMYPLHAYNLNILKVKGRSDLILRLEVIKKLVSVGGIAVALPFGIYGLLFFQLAFSFLGYGINSMYSGRLIGYPAKEQIADMLPSFASSGLSAAVCMLAAPYMYPQLSGSPMLHIIYTASLFFLAYGVVSAAFRVQPAIDLKNLILKK